MTTEDMSNDALQRIVRTYAKDPIVAAVAKEFIQTWYKSDYDSCITDCDTIRRVLSDALREAGCDLEWIHNKILYNFGFLTAETIVEEMMGLKINWYIVNTRWGRVDFDDPEIYSVGIQK